MAKNELSKIENQRQGLTDVCRPGAAEDLGQDIKRFVPASAEVAGRAYFNFVNQGSLGGHDVQHWLDAEAELAAEHEMRLLQSPG